MSEAVGFCTTPECNRLTTLHLCTVCIVELADLLQDIPPILDRIDAVIYRMTVTRAPGSSGGGGGVASSTPAMNVDAYMLKAHLHSLPYSAHAEAMENPEAGWTLFMARDWISTGRDLVWGPEDKRVYGRCGEPIQVDTDAEEEPPEQMPCPGQLIGHPDDASVKCPDCAAVHLVHEVLDRLRTKARGEPMTPRGVREYLQKKARVVVSKFDFENWVKLGKLAYVLDRVNTEGKAQRIYYPGDVLHVFENMRARRRTQL
ncbi:hypothetical protein [Pseudarthrobacter cellobiosi]|uniref:hypothetical protein n=1 Tax=Pseudarthrobacter cellobiosi TaxID=2953654 RepID=UPI00208E3539|nr:hypothetical protein [Pseudarthrobacter sp. HLT1-5]MCO4256497.1 hypothetical protein [Pseudarthrobacter sp. HLT1-5]